MTTDAAEFEEIKRHIQRDLEASRTIKLTRAGGMRADGTIEVIPQGTSDPEIKYEMYYYFEVSGTNPKTNEFKEKKLEVVVGRDSITDNPLVNEELAYSTAVSDVYTHYPPAEGWVIKDITITYTGKKWDIAKPEYE